LSCCFRPRMTRSNRRHEVICLGFELSFPNCEDAWDSSLLEPKCSFDELCNEAPSIDCICFTDVVISLERLCPCAVQWKVVCRVLFEMFFPWYMYCHRRELGFCYAFCLCAPSVENFFFNFVVSILSFACAEQHHELTLHCFIS
jgi:hypothetical protein